MSLDAPSASLSDYQLEEVIGRGGMGEVWRARDSRGRPVAIKRLLVEGEAGDQRGRRLLREARALERVAGEHVVQVHGAGLDDQGSPFLVLEWLAGESLAQRMARQPLTLAEGLEVVSQVLEGLAQCHLGGVVHRDLKPSNVFVLRGDPLQIKLIDLGLAFVGQQATLLTTDGQVLGTPAYLAPEQARGERGADPRADVYSAGVLLYELCTGRRPFRSDIPLALLFKIVSQPAPSPRALVPELPEELDAAIRRAMDKDPQRRFADAGEFRAALAAVTLPSELCTVARPHETSGARCDAERTPRERRLVSLLCLQAIDGRIASEVDEALRAAAHERGGELVPLLDAYRMVLFGAEQTHGDEAQRAVRVGLAALRAAPEATQLRCLGATVHVELSALGVDSRELELATRALERLPAGQLFADPSTRVLCGEGLRVGDATAPGGLEAVVGLALEPGAPAAQPPLVGRETELATLHAAASRVIEHDEAEALLLVGPAGLGKSRLVGAALPVLREGFGLLLEGRTRSWHGSSPYALLADALTRAAGIQADASAAERRRALRAFVGRFVGAEVGEVSDFVGAAIGVPMGHSEALQVARDDPKVMLQRITRSFELLLGGACRQAPSALVLEDLHWADSESLALLSTLLERLEDAPLLLLASCRPELLRREPALFAEVDGTRLELSPLGRRPLRRLVRGLLGGKAEPQLEARILEWSHGNPYFAEQLLGWLGAEGLLEQGEQGWRTRQDVQRLELPTGIKGAIQSRLDALGGAQKELLKAASVFGEVFWERGLTAILGDSARLQLQSPELRELVVRRETSRFAGSPEWIFRHVFLQQVAYQMLPQQRRQATHLAAGRWLEGVGEPDASLLAYHYQSGGDADNAGRLFIVAGERALDDGELEHAASCFRAAERGQGASRRRLLGLARTTILLGEHDEASAALDALPDGDGEQRGDTLFLRGRVALAQARYQEAEQLLSDDTLRERFEAMHSLFYVLWVQGRYSSATPVARSLHQIAERDGRSDRRCAAALAQCYVEQQQLDGDLCRAAVLAREAAEQARAAGLAHREVDALILAGYLCGLLGQYEQAEQSLREAEQGATRLATSFHRASIDTLLGRVLGWQGREREALCCCEAAISRARSLGDDRLHANALVVQAHVLAETDGERAEDAAQQAIELAAGRLPAVEAEARAALAKVLLGLGDGRRAAARGRRAVQILDALDGHTGSEIEILVAAAEALAAVGDVGEAEALWARARAVLERRAAALSDESMREAFLERPRHHRALL
jgi:tetratricopeptide (TPR) repeat protein